MNNFNVVFTTIKEYCKEVEVPNYKCYKEIEQIVESNKIFLSAHLYLEILEDMGLIKFNHAAKTISLTEKGMNTCKLFDS